RLAAGVPAGGLLVDVVPAHDEPPFPFSIPAPGPAANETSGPGRGIISGRTSGALPVSSATTPGPTSPMRPCLLPLALAALLAAARPAGADDKPANDKLNTRIDFTLPGPGGKSFALHDLKDPRAVVVVFL